MVAKLPKKSKKVSYKENWGCSITPGYALLRKRSLDLVFFKPIGIQGVPKKVTIGPPKPQFLSETFEIFTVGRLFYSGFSTFFRFEKF